MRPLSDSGAILSLSDVLERARALRPGRVLEAELEDEDGRYIYEVEMLDEEGRVWELYSDARSGELLKVRREY